jgi:hypothetical protein
MARLRAISGGKGKEKTFSLVYGLRLCTVGTVSQVEEGKILHGDGGESWVPLHLIEGTREQIRTQLLASIDAFFDIYGGDSVPLRTPSCFPSEEVGEPGC